MPSYMPKIQYVTDSLALGIPKPRMGQRRTPIVRYRLEYLLLGPSGDLGLPAQPSTRTRPSDHPHLAALSSAAEELVGAVGFEP